MVVILLLLVVVGVGASIVHCIKKRQNEGKPTVMHVASYKNTLTLMQ